jgi:hypothetical protein
MTVDREDISAHLHFTRFMATQDPREVYPWAALTANIDPHAVNSLVWGAFTGATACIGAVVSPMVSQREPLVSFDCLGNPKP